MASPESAIQTSEDRKKKNPTSDTVVCTACSQRLDAYRLDWLRRHPVLDVLICKKCYLMHSNEIQIGEDGMDEACRWCALEGDLICCDFCHNVFCKLCIRRNLGRMHLNIILNAEDDQKWQCYVCNPEPLAGLVNMCNDILKNAEEDQEAKRLVDPNLQSDLSDDFNSPDSSPKPKKRKYTKKTVKPSEEVEGSEEKVEDEVKDKKDDSISEEKEEASKENIIYIKTPSGEIVAVQSSAKQTTQADVPMKRPKGRPRLNRDGATPTTSGKKYPRLSSQYKNTPSSLAAVADLKLSLRPPHIDQHNVWNVLEKLLAATQSMTMLLSSLKEDLKRTATLSGGRTPEAKKKRKEVASKMWRAFLAYKKSFVDIEIYTKKRKKKLELEMGKEKEEGAPVDESVGEEINEEEEEEEEEAAEENIFQDVLKRGSLKEGSEAQEEEEKGNEEDNLEGIVAPQTAETQSEEPITSLVTEESEKLTRPELNLTPVSNGLSSQAAV